MRQKERLAPLAHLQGAVHSFRAFAGHPVRLPFLEYVRGPYTPSSSFSLFFELRQKERLAPLAHLQGAVHSFRAFAGHPSLAPFDGSLPVRLAILLRCSCAMEIRASRIRRKARQKNTRPLTGSLFRLLLLPLLRELVVKLASVHCVGLPLRLLRLLRLL